MGEPAPALHRVRAAAMLEQGFGEHVRRARERPVDLAVSHVELGDQVVGRVAMGRRRAVGQGCPAVRDRRQDVVVDLDQRRRVLGDIAVVGDDDGDRLADMGHLVVGERGPVAVLLVARARQADDQPRGGQRRHQIGQRVDRVDARMRARRRRLDAVDGGVGVRAAEKRGLERPRQPNVVDEAAAPAQQRRILQPLDTDAEYVSAHPADPCSVELG